MATVEYIKFDSIIVKMYGQHFIFLSCVVVLFFVYFILLLFLDIKRGFIRKWQRVKLQRNIFGQMLYALDNMLLGIHTQKSIIWFFELFSGKHHKLSLNYQYHWYIRIVFDSSILLVNTIAHTSRKPNLQMTYSV